MVSTTGMVVSLKTDLRFPESGQQGHGAQIIQKICGFKKKNVFVQYIQMKSSWYKNVLKNKSSCVILKSQSYSSCNETKFFIYQICLCNSEAQKDRAISKGRKTRKAG